MTKLGPITAPLEQSNMWNRYSTKMRDELFGVMGGITLFSSKNAITLQKDQYFAYPIYALIKHLKATKKTTMTHTYLNLNLNTMEIQWKMRKDIKDMQTVISSGIVSLLRYNDVYVEILDYYVANKIPVPPELDVLYRKMRLLERKYKMPFRTPDQIWEATVAVSQIALDNAGTLGMTKYDRDIQANNFWVDNGPIRVMAVITRPPAGIIDPVNGTQFSWSITTAQINIPLSTTSVTLPATITTLPAPDIATLRIVTDKMVTEYNNRILAQDATIAAADADFVALRDAFKVEYDTNVKQMVDDMTLVEKMDKVI